MRVILFAALAIVVGWICYRRIVGTRMDDSTGDNSPVDWVPAPERNLTIYIGLPMAGPVRWSQVKSYDRRRLDLGDGTIVAPHEVASYLLVYPNQEILDSRNMFHPLPAGLKMLMREEHSPQSVAFDPTELALGEAICQVTHSRVRRGTDVRLTYATSLTNRSTTPIRILKFAGFHSDGDRYRLSTVSGDYYSAEQFTSWYATKPDGWIQPGERVADDSNYGGGDGIWAYFGETQDGRRFIALAAIPKLGD